MSRWTFARKTIQTLAARSGFRCSNPSCQRLTSGPHTDPDKIVDIGVIAHISAVSPAGQRYDPSKADAERQSIDNAIWLCATCAKLIDYDAHKYSAEILRGWKAHAEQVATAALSSFQDGAWPQDIKSQCRALMQACDEAPSTGQKGKSLEDLVEVLFTSGEGLVLADKRVSTDDEEIDLVCINNVNRPFWLALTSPLLFVECKNWTKNVGTKEIRDFEIKLQNHGAMTKIGFFVSLNGFTSEVASELKRMGRSAYHVVLIERQDIVEYLASDVGILNWLETKMCKLR